MKHKTSRNQRMTYRTRNQRTYPPVPLSSYFWKSQQPTEQRLCFEGSDQRGGEEQKVAKSFWALRWASGDCCHWMGGDCWWPGGWWLGLDGFAGTGSKKSEEDFWSELLSRIHRGESIFEQSRCVLTSSTWGISRVARSGCCAAQSSATTPPSAQWVALEDGNWLWVCWGKPKKVQGMMRHVEKIWVSS